MRKLVKNAIWIIVVLAIIAGVIVGVYLYTSKKNDSSSSDISTIAGNDYIVTTNNGKLQGKVLPTPINQMYAFQGIPYAVPPLGDLKFQATKPIGNWTGIRSATKEGKSCLSVIGDPSKQSEDCLYLNVYTPTLNKTAKLAVITFIPGGRYIAGNGDLDSYGPGFLIDQNIIIVTFNYRLGPFGLLGTEDLLVPGNAALKDQVLAMKWVKDNIVNFGGDPEKITILGQSAGGSACGLHILSKKSQGLFRAAICISGSALTPWSIFNSPRNYTYALANILNSSITKDTDVKEVVSFLKNQDPSTIIGAANTIMQKGIFEKEDDRLTPCLEADHKEAFLTEKPYQLLINGNFNKVPLLMGINNEEALIFVPDKTVAITEAKKLDKEPGYVLPYNFTLKSNVSLTEVDNYLKAIYLKDNETFSSSLDKVVKFKSDDMFTRGTIKHALMQSNFTDVFFYEFCYRGDLNFQLAPGEFPGPEMSKRCGHGDDLRHIFMRGVNYTIKSEELVVVQRMTTLVANFAKYLNPTPTKQELFQNLTWPKVKPDNFQYLNITDNLKIAKDCKNETFPKWTYVYNTWDQTPFRSF